MLDQSVKADIKTCYEKLKETLPDFVPRKAQNYLIAELAKTLAGEYNPERRILVAEAGTGIGKSMAYLIGAIPFALHAKKKVIISTATVALQEQLITKDLPLFASVFAEEFTFILAKGRSRYCCEQKLAQFAENNLDSDRYDGQIAFEFKPTTNDITQLQELYTALGDQTWNGERDSWPSPISDELWQSIVSDKYQCRPRQSGHSDCPFTKSREKLRTADVIVVNHSLLMASLEVGNGWILPEPEDAIYVIDEAHHLPIVCRDHTAASASVAGSIKWLDSLEKLLKKFDQLEANEAITHQEEIQNSVNLIRDDLKTARDMFSEIPFNADGNYRFLHGEIPDPLIALANELAKQTEKANKRLQKLFELTDERLQTNQIVKHLAESLIRDTSFFIGRLDNLQKVWALMAQKNPDRGAPLARWIVKHPTENREFIVHVSPLEIGFQLEDKLWSRACGIGLFSATFRALNSFKHFCFQAGLSEADGSRFLALSSPFDYEKQGKLVIPNLPYEPQHEKFTDILPTYIMEYLQDHSASLVLFSSYWQMNKVAEMMEKSIEEKGWQLQVQGKASRGWILQKHQQYCEKGKVSILFGTGSFSEGLDLPGTLLTNVIITKIPFAQPTSPIEEAHSEYVEAKGGNSFMQISVPEASKKLIQAVGRLLRKEEDAGQVVILDRRIMTKRYGKELLNALPPFSRHIESD